MPKSVFEVLNKIDVNEHTEQKGNLTYLSWAWAWAEVKKKYPTVKYTIYESEQGWNYHHDNRTAWVKTGVVIEELEHIEYLPVLDFKNKSITLDKLTSFNVNTAIQRSLTKAIARHGLGLYIYAGEDLPDMPLWTKDTDREEHLLSMKENCGESNFEAIKKEWRSLTNRQQTDVWKGFDDQEKLTIKESLRHFEKD